MTTRAYLFLYLALVLSHFTGCTINRIDSITINPAKASGSLEIRQSGHKSALGENSRVDALTDIRPETAADIGAL